MDEFISEDDLQTFEGWLKSQGEDASPMNEDELGNWRRIFDDVNRRSAAIPKVGLMKLKSVPDEYRYAVAVQDGANLWLTLWVKRSPKGEFFVFMPRGDRTWDVHTSYHRDGTLHLKSFGRKALMPQQHQPLALNGDFLGDVHLGCWKGHGPKNVGAICDPTAFSGVVTVAPGVLGPMHGWITVDLTEPGQEPTQVIPCSRIILRETFRDFIPWVVITVGSETDMPGNAPVNSRSPATTA